MAKKTVTIGSVVPSKEGKTFYIKVIGNHQLSNGQCISLENETSQLARIKELVELNILNEEQAEQRMSEIKTYWSNKKFVKFNLVVRTDT